MILWLLSGVGAVVGFFTMVFLIALGLYFISEQVEEHSVLAKKVIVQMIWAVIACHALLWLFDGLSFWKTAFSIAINCVYLQTMKQFPLVEVTSPQFIVGCVGAVLNHFLWTRHFYNPDLPPYTVYEHIPTFKGETLPPFREIASFFGLLVWAVPLTLFISLSAGDNVLPTTAEGTADKKNKHKGMLRVCLETAWAKVAEIGALLGWNITSENDRIV